MLMPMSLFPAPPAPLPCASPFPDPAEPGELPGAPGLPSGDMATRAARLPCGAGVGGGQADFGGALLEIWKFRRRCSRRCDSFGLMGMKFGEGLLADLNVRTRWSLRGGESHDVGHWRKEFRGLRWSCGIDQGLSGVRRVDRIRVDALAGMVGIHTFLGGRRIRLYFRRR